MKRSLTIALALFALIAGIAPWTATLAQWGPPPGAPGASSAPAWPSSPPGGTPSGAQGGGAAWPSGPPGMPGGPPTGNPQGQCSQFPQLNAEAKKRADAVQAAIKAKVERKQVCALLTTFVAAETNVVKFLVDNRTTCGVPDQAITMSKAEHEKSVKFKTMACNTDGPPPQKAPTLSDAIKTPSVDSATNTKTGRGTFDTLTGNPLAR
ncbi:MAG: hypothetical protein WBQ24_12305 [Xanthobacteraceae bacterium]